MTELHDYQREASLMRRALRELRYAAADENNPPAPEKVQAAARQRALAWLNKIGEKK